MSGNFFVFILFAFTATYCLWVACRYRWLLWPLVIAYLTRGFLFFLDYFNIFHPPGSTADGARFTRIANELAQLSWHELFMNLNVAASTFYSWLGAVLQKLVGETSLILPATSFLFGHVVVATTGIMVYQLWGKRPAIIASLIIAVYPFAAFNSVVAMREEVAIMFFMVGLFHFTRWVGGKSVLGLLWGSVFFGVAVAFHPGWIGAFVGMAAYLMFFLYRAIFKSDTKNASRLDAFKVILSSAVLFFSLAMVVFGGGVSLGKGISLGGEGEEGGIGAAIESRFMGEASGGSAYPSFIAQGNPYTQPWLIPARIVYFHFSPFPWDVRSPRHLLGVVSSVLYFFLAWRIYKGWGSIKRKEECIALLLIFGALTFIFAIGVTNIGTAVRHKAKLLGIFLILAASSFNSIRLKLRRE